MSTDPQKSALVVSAHSADFVWRAGGAIALHARQGWHVKIVCLSFGYYNICISQYSMFRNLCEY